MGIANNGCSNQHENPCPNNGTDTKAGQIPGRQRLSEPVGGMVGVGQDLFNRFSPEEMGDHRASIHGGSRRRTVEDIFMVHVPSSIAGGCAGYVLALSASSSLEKGLEEATMRQVTVEEKFRMPLDTQQKPL